MGLIVQKFGGTSVGSVERIREVATRVERTRAQGHGVIVVVSAMAGETNRLLELGRAFSARPNEREMDALASTGEQVTAALLAIQLIDRGIPARSLLGDQVGILTDSAFTKARIKAIDGGTLLKTIANGEVAVVAGFQGVDEQGNITTLGRGGSDTTAVAIAAATRATVCEIYTDVDGVYTADPNVCPTARKIARITYEEMLELASLGAKVLQIRSVEVAMKYAVPIHVRSSFSESEGTMVAGEEDAFEGLVVAGVTCDRKETKIVVRGLPATPTATASLFEALAEANISVDMIVQSDATEQERANVTFTVPKSDAPRALEMTERAARELSAATARTTNDPNIAKVSIVGLGMRSHAGVASKMFRLLGDQGIAIQAISTSEIKISVLIEDKWSDLAVRVLHDGFGLGDT